MAAGPDGRGHRSEEEEEKVAQLNSCAVAQLYSQGLVGAGVVVVDATTSPVEPPFTAAGSLRLRGQGGAA